jgi:hypothetical protein
VAYGINPTPLFIKALQQVNLKLKLVMVMMKDMKPALDVIGKVDELLT